MTVHVAVGTVREGLLFRMSLYSCSLPFAQGMLVFVAAMKQKAVSYISQAADLNFLLYLHIWSWYARRSGARWGYRDRVE